MHRVFRLGATFAGMLTVGLLAVATGASQDPTEKSDEPQATALIGNKASHTYHLATCPLAKRLPAKAKQALESTDAAEQAGYKACPQCKPKAADEPGSTDADPKPETGGAAKQKTRSKSAAVKTKSKAAGDDTLRFSRDIAPILAGNCNTCHNAQNKRGEFIISTFESLMKGSKSGEVIVPGKPDESLLVELVEERKMPRGGNRTLSDDAIGKIRDWVKQGALLDQGIDPKATLDQIAPSAEEMRRERLSQLSENEVDQKTEQVGRDRWKKATSNNDPRVTTTRGFLIFSNMPEERAVALGRSLDSIRNTLGNMFSDDPNNVLKGPEKISVYVFNSNNEYAELLRGVEQREMELGVESHARLGVESPYIAAIDPHGGKAEPAPAKGKSSRKKDAEAMLGAPTRGLSALVTDALASGLLESSGKPPRWLSEGFGAYVSSQVEPRGAYFAKLRTEAAQQFQIGRTTRLTEVLGDEGSPEAIRALGFSLCEWMAGSARQAFPNFVLGMTQEGTSKLDDIIKACFGPESSREDLLREWSGFIATRYGARRR